MTASSTGQMEGVGHFMRWNAFIAVIHPGEDLKLRFRDSARRFAPFRRAARCIEISSQRISVWLEPPPAQRQRLAVPQARVWHGRAGR